MSIFGRWTNDKGLVVEVSENSESLVGLDGQRIIIAKYTSACGTSGSVAVTEKMLEDRGFLRVGSLEHWFRRAERVLGDAPDPDQDDPAIIHAWDHHVDELDDVRVRAVAALRDVLGETEAMRSRGEIEAAQKIRSLIASRVIDVQES